ncbi:MAG: HD domain-containing protein [Alphaproteobacteria bacterium]|nr:HD domain-containing protein [Alphaproteobacteria bacterium]
MITENRWKHILGVARKAKKLALKFKPNDDKFAEDMFLLGLLHDFGYEFIESNASHSVVGGEILARNQYKYWQEVSLHGNETVESMSDALFILNCADMSTGPSGEDFTFEERLSEIANRFGTDAAPYKTCVIEVGKLKVDARYIKLR